MSEEVAQIKYKLTQPYKVLELPDGKFGQWTLEHITLDESQLGFLMGVTLDEFMQGRGIVPGEYVIVRDEDGHPWMSDTPAELWDHSEILELIANHDDCRTMLVSGLGLGVTLKMAVMNGVTDIDVVEIDKDIIEYVGTFWQERLEEQYECTISFYHGDAFVQSHELATKHYDIAWHDIWPRITSENLEEMDAIEAMWANSVDLQACWGRDMCQWMKEVEDAYS